MATKVKEKLLQVEISHALNDRLKEAAARSGISKSDFVRIVLMRVLESGDPAYRFPLAALANTEYSQDAQT